MSWTDHCPILDGGADRTEDDGAGPYHLVHHIESSALIPHRGHWLLFGIDRGGINYWESPSMEHFDYRLRKPLWKNVGPGELVWRQGTLWLMAACRWEGQYDVPGSVLRFGEVDWSDADPQVHMITQETHIGEWMKWISDGCA